MYPNLSSTNNPFVTNPKIFELMDAGVVISDLDIQEIHNHYSNDPECAIDNFIEDIEYNEDDEYTNISYEQLMVQIGELAHTIQNNQSQYVAIMPDINKIIQHYRNDHDF